MDPKTGELSWFEWIIANTSINSLQYGWLDVLETEQKEIIDRETATINEKYWYSLLRWILQFSIPSFDEPNYWVAETKLYPFYLYALLITLQDICRTTSNELTSSELIEKIKNTTTKWQEEIDEIEQKNYQCFQRLLIYESILKTTLGLSYSEKDFNIIVKQFPKTIDLTDEQIQTLKNKILDPLFYGLFKQDFKGPFSVIICDQNLKSCINDTIKQFPYPEINEGYAIPDILTPVKLFNSISYQKGQGFALLKHAIGTLDWMFEKLTGVKAFWTHKAGKEAENLANTLAGAVSEINKKLKDAYSFGAGVISSASQAGELITPVLILGGLALGLSLVNRVLGD